MRTPILFLPTLLTLLSAGAAQADAPRVPDPHPAARDFRPAGQPVTALADGSLLAEAEEFRPTGPGGWQPRRWGSNYYVATFANSFLSRKAYLGAPEQADRAAAVLEVTVPKPGRYLALVRYEAVYRYETRFRLQVAQGGRTRLDRLCGARDNLKVWAFGEKLKKEVAWSWGAGENLVWEGHDALVDLDAGPATLTLTADRQPERAARRNVDCVLLTPHADQVKARIDKESYLPLDGMLTQEGDLYLKVHVPAGSPAVTLHVPPGTEHSPYWVHQRTWKPKTVTAAPGQTTDWIEVGSLLDTLNDGQWKITAKADGPPRYDLAFGLRRADGRMTCIRRFDSLGAETEFAYDADTRYSGRIRKSEDVLYDLVSYLRQHPVPGSPPRRTLVYGATFSPRPGDARYTAALNEFLSLMGATALGPGQLEDLVGRPGPVRGYIDVRGQSPEQLDKLGQKLKAEGKADRIAVVSLGDEIGLAAPPANDQSGFRAWLKTQGVKPADLDPAAGDDFGKLSYSPTPDTARTRPGLYYWSKIYSYRYGIAQQKALTDALKKHLPHAGVGANFSPHHGSMYLGPTYQWISLFREAGMTMPWGEDYIWQVPVATQQMNSIMVDMFRAGLRGRPEGRIHYYVMPHTPGVTPASWRRQFVGDLAHGVQVFNLFEFRPVQAAYTENHTSDPVVYQEIRRTLHELGPCEDIVQDGRVRPGVAALWFSETADAWNDSAAPFDAAKRMLYIAVRHQQVPLDMVVEGDDLSAYRTLYLADRHVSRKAAGAIAAWVQAGGRLFATAGAGLRDEYDRPHQSLAALLGIQPADVELSPGEPIRLGKQDLPYAAPLTEVTLAGEPPGKFPVFGARVRLSPAADARVRATFADGSPALVERTVGKGRVLTCAFLPGPSYFRPALPARPVDRGATDDTLSHFLPTRFDPAVACLVAEPAAGPLPVVCSEPLVETTVLEAKSGTLIPLINWTPAPLKGLTVTVSIPVPAKATLASGRPVRVEHRDGRTVLTLDLDVADLLVLR